MPSDYGHEQTDKLLKELEKRIDKEYSQAAKEVQEKFYAHMKDFERKDAKMQEKLDAGKITESEYQNWRTNQMLTGQRMNALYESLAKDLVNADQIAAGMINDSLPDVYALNMNYSTYKIEHTTEIDTNFTLYDRKTVENLMKDNPRIIPHLTEKQAARIKKDELWNRQHLVSAVAQGILQGEGIPDIAKRLQTVAAMDDNAATRNARTYITAAQNKGRIDSYERAEKLGIETNKKWIATLDDRTRVEHRHLDGVSIPYSDVFKMDGYEIEYPGDPSAEPEMIYNCRCTLVDDIKNWPYNDERRDEKLGDMTYEQWKHAKDKPGKEGTTKQDEEKRVEKEAEKQEKVNAEMPEEFKEDYERLQKWGKDEEVKYLEVKENENPISHDEIVEKIAGGDMTKGSCASLSLAYAGNTCGLDVTDFRGGNSQDMFADKYNLKRMLQISGSDMQIHYVTKEAKDTAELLEKLEKDREYLLVAGKHAAIVRRTEEFGLQYLELQHAKDNGWQLFEKEVETWYGKERRTVAETLVKRFGCRKTVDKLKATGTVVKKEVYLASVDSFKPTKEFKDILGYLNTETGKQKKGEKGGIR